MTAPSDLPHPATERAATVRRISEVFVAKTNGTPWEAWRDTVEAVVEAAERAGYSLVPGDLGRDLAAIHRGLRESLQAQRLLHGVLLFFSSPAWSPEKQAEWERLVGGECTNKRLCDAIREAIGETV